MKNTLSFWKGQAYTPTLVVFLTSLSINPISSFTDYPFLPAPRLAKGNVMHESDGHSKDTLVITVVWLIAVVLILIVLLRYILIHNQ